MQVLLRWEDTQDSFSCVINNSNLGMGTTAEDVLDSVPFAEEICRQTGLPLAASAIWEERAAEASLPMKYPVKIFVTKPWEHGPF